MHRYSMLQLSHLLFTRVQIAVTGTFPEHSKYTTIFIHVGSRSFNVHLFSQGFQVMPFFVLF